MNEQGNRTFEHAAERVVSKGRMATVSICLGLILLLAAAEPIGRHSGAWAFMLHTGITGIAFLGVFLIQRFGQGHTETMQVEFSKRGRSARYLGRPIAQVEEMTEEELDRLHAYYQRLSDTKD